jgi:hypothetical protein
MGDYFGMATAWRPRRVASTFLVDLGPLTTPQISGTGEPDSPLTFAVRVGNFRPPSHGGFIVYEAFGDVALGWVPDRCTTGAPDPMSVKVSCDFDPFDGFVNDTGSVNQPEPVWVGPFQVIPQSEGLVTLSATTVPTLGDTDVNPDNDRIERTLAIGQGVTDLELLSLSLTDPADGQPIQVDQTIEVEVPIRNLGPDDSRGAVLIFSTAENVDLDEVDGPCVDVQTNDAPDAGFSTRCELAPLLAGSGRTVRLRITPHVFGAILLGAVVRPVWSQDTDPTRDNDYANLIVTVEPGG